MLEEITRSVATLTENQQKNVLEYIQFIKDSRTHPRHQKRIEVDALIDNTTLIQSDSRDISASGLFINSNAKVETGKPAKVVLAVPGRQRPFRLNGTVVRTQTNGFAIWFNDMTEYSQEVLEEVLEE